jgi:hypothetical protein
MNRYLIEYTRDKEHFEREIVEARDFTKAYLEFTYAHESDCEITELILIERKEEDAEADNGN